MYFEGFSAVVALFIFLAIPLSVFVLVIARTSRFAHRKRRLVESVIIAEYDPPDGLSPAEIGYLFDSRFNKTELIATLIDLEQKGLLEIDHSSISGLKISRKLNSKPITLKEHEQFVLNNLANQTNLSLYALRHLPGFKSSIKRSLYDQGYIKSRQEAINYYAQRTCIAYLLITFPLFLWLMSDSKEGLLLNIFSFIFICIMTFPFFLGLAMVAGFIYNKIVGQPGLWTKKLKQLWPQLEGYRDYVYQVELDELQFESKELKVRSKNKALPYAIALGLNTKWQKRFES